MSSNRIVPIVVASAILTVASTGLFAQHDAGAPGEATHAIAILHPTEGSKAKGTIHFMKEGRGIRVKGEVTGLARGLHGFHVHEYGDCHSPEAKSAGGHFNPEKQKHSGPSTAHRHVGDLGNIEANDAGVATIDLLDDLITLHGAHSIIGRGLIVHAKADDLKTDPTGNAGDRAACAVIGIAKPE